MHARGSDRILLGLAAILVIFGFIIFASASLGLLTRGGASFSAVALKQLVFGIGLGSIFLIAAASLHYRAWRRLAFWFFLTSLVATILVFVPSLGLEHGGAKRWLQIGSFSFQPGEILKLAFVIYFAAWLSAIKDRSQVTKFGMIPFGALSALCGAVLLLQPDTDGFLIIALSGIAMLFAAGMNWRHILVVILAAVVLGGGLLFYRPYLKERLLTFINWEQVDSLGAGYQINQSLIAIGSGGLTGKGFGQSVQKFEYLPEPIGDSIFAVAGEEFGFAGAAALVFLFLIFGLRALHVANRAADNFAAFLSVGIIVLIVGQSFMNIASMLGLFPLSGTPLVFVSQGGTALMVALLEVGILLNISKYQRS